MSRIRNLYILPQPDNRTCGPTCLHALYSYYNDPISLETVINEVEMLNSGGTLAVLLGTHALRRGYEATIYTHNLQVFDPTWFTPSKKIKLADKLAAQQEAKTSKKMKFACAAYLDFLSLGGKISFVPLTSRLIRTHLRQGVPILTGLSSTYLYNCARENPETGDYDDIGGDPTGHFVLLYGYNKKDHAIYVADPYHPNPISEKHRYEVKMDRLIGAILLGIVTYDANLLIVRPKTT